MYVNRYPGMFIVFEGLDGSGQSTQAKFLYDFFRKQEGRQVVLTKEPTGDSEAGRKVRRVLKKEIEMRPDEFQKLYVQDRKEHLSNLIIPSLEKGAFVISDRYFLSTCAFGGINLDIEWLIKINEKFILPNITFFLDVAPEICIERIGERGKGFEFFEEVEKLTKVRQNYKVLAKRFQNVYLVNGEQLREKVFADILDLLGN